MQTKKLIEIYDNILRQVDKYFKLYDINKFRAKLHDGRSKFVELDDFGQDASKEKVIIKILRGLHFGSDLQNLKEIGFGTTPLGQFQVSEAGIRLSNTAFIIFKSPTGLFNRKLYLKNL